MCKPHCGSTSTRLCWPSLRFELIVACESSTMSEAVVMEPPREAAFTDESSEEESTGEREEAGANEVTAAQTVNAPRPSSLSVPVSSDSAPLWTSRGNAEVRLRMGESGIAAEPPLTINQMFMSSVERFGDYTALGWKDGEQQKTMTYKEYYQTCRVAAKGFLKVY
ncbi:hypothetical protein NQD34_002828 [Periophthalmus magnuspinnatus]|nr:hypothetical protein NQD34_002828 [Periophthalmus magnuspinnatus]